jgi:uncharacterized protein
MKILFLLFVLAAMCTVAMGQQREGQQPPLLTVTGNAEAMADPDLATVRLGVLAQAATAQQAQEQANTIVQELLKRLQALGIARQDIQSSRITLSPVYDHRPEQRTPRIVGYQAQNVLAVRLTDFALVGRVIDAGVAAGVNTIEGVHFGLRDELKARSAALRDAAANARAKAEVLAEAMGVKLGAIYEISEGGGYVAPPPMANFRMMEAAAATPVEPGQMQVNATVTIRYVIISR